MPESSQDLALNPPPQHIFFFFFLFLAVGGWGLLFILVEPNFSHTFTVGISLYI